jgi:hypothetical protein
MFFFIQRAMESRQVSNQERRRRSVSPARPLHSRDSPLRSAHLALGDHGRFSDRQRAPAYSHGPNIPIVTLIPEPPLSGRASSPCPTSVSHVCCVRECLLSGTRVSCVLVSANGQRQVLSMNHACVCMYVCVYAYVFVCICIYMYIYTYICICTHIYYVSKKGYVCIYTCTYTYTYTYINIYIYIYIHTHTHIHTHTLIHICMHTITLSPPLIHAYKTHIHTYTHTRAHILKLVHLFNSEMDMSSSIVISMHL